MKIAISGAIGFLGKYLVNYLHDSGYTYLFCTSEDKQLHCLI